jgi:hypothetical protein
VLGFEARRRPVGPEVFERFEGQIAVAEGGIGFRPSLVVVETTMRLRAPLEVGQPLVVVLAASEVVEDDRRLCAGVGQVDDLRVTARGDRRQDRVHQLVVVLLAHLVE